MEQGPQTPLLGCVRAGSDWVLCAFHAGCPPEVLDASQGKSADVRKTWLEEQAQILKQIFW